MKKILAALVLSLALPAATCRADDCCFSFGHCGTLSYGFRVKICGCLKWMPCSGPCCGGCNSGCSFGGCGSGCGGYGGGGGMVTGPWYSYWPLEAHFQVPAPTGYQYWPSPMVSTMATGAYQTAGYFGPTPSYWYGH
jgi:hypothetical protein